MPERKLLIAMLLASAVLNFIAVLRAKPPEPPLTGKVVAVTDGDTVTLLVDGEQKKIRLAEIDAPESKQPFGEKSKDFLAQRTLNKEATVKVDTIDRYGRYVGHVGVEGVDINREMVSQGYAWVYRAYSKDKTLIAFEEAAFRKKRGLWAGKDPVPPWKWRQMSAEQREAERKKAK